MINTLDISVDSLRLSFPLEKTEILSTSLLGRQVIKLTVDESTGEQIDESFTELNSEYITFEENDVTYQIKARIENRFGTKYLALLLNSKILERDYLQGITKTNIKHIYEKLNGIIFNMSYSQFLKGSPSDIDLKKDIRVESKEVFDSYTQELKSFTKPTRNKKQGVNRISKPINKGIEWNSREHSTSSRPFLKMYHKGIETNHGEHSAFFNKYIPKSELENRARIEVTIKNKNQAKQYDIDISTLESLLSTPQDELHKVLETAIKKNLLPRLQAKRSKPNEELSGTDLLLFIHLSNMIKNQSYDYYEALEWTLKHFENKQDKYRMKKRLEAIYEQNINGEIYAQKTNNLSSFFKDFGWS